MATYVRTSLLDGFDIPEVTHETIKKQLIKVGRSHAVVQKQVPYASLPPKEKLKVIEKEVYKALGRYKGFVKVIYDIDTLNKYIDKAIEVDYLAFDTETNNSLDPLTCKLMGLCLYIPNTRPVYVPINHCYPETENLLPNQVTEEQARQALERLHEKNTKVVMHNGKFDIRVIYNTLGFYMPIWWDTMLAAQLIDENERAGLKPQYKKYIDPTIGTYSIDKLFAGIPYAWVDPEVFALYAAIDSYDTYQLQKHQEKVFNTAGMEKLKKLFLDIEVPVTLVVSKMEDAGIDLDIDFVNKLNAKYHRGLDAAANGMTLCIQPYQDIIRVKQLEGVLDDPINYNSSQQLQIILYDILKIPTIADRGRATDANTLELLGHDFTKHLLDYRHFAKLISAFTEALPKLCSPRDGKIHASFNQMGKEENNVRTGRFSSTDPNLQQIPSHEKVMRLMFKASPGHVIVGGDFSQQEPRILTHMCKDPKLIETYNNNRDLYATIAASVFKKDYWECMEYWEDGTPNPTGKDIRKKAKGLVLGIMYGMGAKLMSSIIKVSVEECKSILEEFYKMFPTVKEFTTGNETMAKELGYVEDYMGRRRHLPDINLPEVEIKAYKSVELEDNYIIDHDDTTLKILDEDTIDKWTVEYFDKRKIKKFEDKVKFKEEAKSYGVDVFDNGAFISKTMTQCTNARIQGGAATLTKKAMVEIANDKRLNELGFKLLIPVHDELLGECPAENAEEVKPLLVDAMIRAGKPECSVNMKVDTYCVKYWYSDEVENAIRESYLNYINGNKKKNLDPISPEAALDKLQSKYCELSPETVKLMCEGQFDHVNGTL